MSLINREALYEEACDLEAQALSYVAKIANDKTKIEEWKIWSAILIERTAFKHDIFDAPEELPSARPEITPDGTLKVTVDADIASIGRILLSQAGTQCGGLYYKDAQPEITLESAIDYLHSIGWMQEHDRVLSSAQPEGTCESCLHQELEWDEEPCDGCTVGGDTNHYEPAMERRTDD